MAISRDAALELLKSGGLEGLAKTQLGILLPIRFAPLVWTIGI
jgi:hypothetical protein